MIEFENIEGIYFVGIGGIGMSALALYFAKGGYDNCRIRQVWKAAYQSR